MSDFFERLLLRGWGRLPLVRPRIASRFEDTNWVESTEPSLRGFFEVTEARSVGARQARPTARNTTHPGTAPSASKHSRSAGSVAPSRKDAAQSECPTVERGSAPSPEVTASTAAAPTQVGSKARPFASARCSDSGSFMQPPLREATSSSSPLTPPLTAHERRGSELRPIAATETSSAPTRVEASLVPQPPSDQQRPLRSEPLDEALLTELSAAAKAASSPAVSASDVERDEQENIGSARGEPSQPVAWPARLHEMRATGAFGWVDHADDASRPRPDQPPKELASPARRVAAGIEQNAGDSQRGTPTTSPANEPRAANELPCAARRLEATPLPEASPTASSLALSLDCAAQRALATASNTAAARESVTRSPALLEVGQLVAPPDGSEATRVAAAPAQSEARPERSTRVTAFAARPTCDAKAEHERSVRVSIGKVHVRAVMPVPQPTRPAATPAPAPALPAPLLSLDQYLSARDGGRK